MIGGCRRQSAARRIERGEERLLGTGDGGSVHQVVITAFQDLGGQVALLGFLEEVVSTFQGCGKVSLAKTNLKSEFNTLGLPGGLHFLILGFLVYNDHLGFEVGFFSFSCAMVGTPEGCGSPPMSSGSESAGTGVRHPSAVPGEPVQLSQSIRVPVFERLSYPTSEKVLGKNSGKEETVKPNFAVVVGKSAISTLEFFPLEDKKLVVVSLPKELTKEAVIASKGYNNGKKKWVDADGFTLVGNKQWKPKPKVDDGAKGDDEGINGTKEGDHTNNATVEIRDQNSELGVSGDVIDEGYEVDARGVLRFLLTRAPPLSPHQQRRWEQVPCNPTNEHIANTKEVSAMQAETTLGGFDTVGTKHTVEPGNTRADENVKKTEPFKK
ncbi:hypothetical protein L6452_43554 [Arctium lappa]|uniref:Uncharacterized protein n=1 Tax=Arctium lappa TaxID=4217 RepID=A0ACB8XDI1_ARCLA|nr:hypothetical protein L6452_43554 [Arctium lappa]